MKTIILTTLNSRFIHSSFGLRYLYANLHELQSRAKILEFSINEQIQSIVEAILLHEPKIVGIGVYIWNAAEVKLLIEILKKISPNTIIVLGGPEVSYLPIRVDYAEADYIIQNEAEESFYALCKDILNNTMPPTRIIQSALPKLKALKLPYEFYTDEDIKNRYVYVEISRGCPFLCEFCLSSMDEKVRSFSIDTLLGEFEMLWQKGVRNFKFIDRTFNINIRSANKILDYFLSKKEMYHIHFEVIPDHFPQSIKDKLIHFQPGSLQFEIGIQTLNPEIANNISRPLHMKEIVENISFLNTIKGVHMHLDLLVGLPGESLESFGNNLNQLVALSDAEIQLGILKKLSGTHISRHDEMYGMIYSDIPPYDILQTSTVSFFEIQKMKRFARFWDIVYNSGNFKRSVTLIWKDVSVYEGFSAFSLWLYGQSSSTYKISMDRMAQFLFEYIALHVDIKKEEIASHLLEDILRFKGRSVPKFLKEYAKERNFNASITLSGLNKRQAKHL